MHQDELTITESHVRALLADQAPEFADRPVQRLHSSGTVNAIFRIGDGATARFPLQPSEPAAYRERLLLDAERMRRFRELAPVAAPEPLLVGAPGHGYPMPWSLQTWLDGELPTPTSHAGSLALARDVAGLIAALRSVVVGDQPFTGGGRGGRIVDHEDWVLECFDRSEHLLDVPALRAAWAQLRELPPPERNGLCHTDLIPANLLVDGEHLVGVVDTGDLQPADPALDLVVAWHLFDTAPRAFLREHLSVDDAEWERGRAWALVQAVGLVWYYLDSNPVMADLGRTAVTRVLGRR